jgi:hypothetical protein
MWRYFWILVECIVEPCADERDGVYEYSEERNGWYILQCRWVLFLSREIEHV